MSGLPNNFGCLPSGHPSGPVREIPHERYNGVHFGQIRNGQIRIMSLKIIHPVSGASHSNYGGSCRMPVNDIERRISDNEGSFHAIFPSQLGASPQTDPG